MIKNFLFVTLLFLSHTLHSENIIYLNEGARQLDIEKDPQDSWGRLSLGHSQLESELKELLKGLAPVTQTFPFAVYTEGRLFYKSDDNCTIIPEKLFSKDITTACRKHDYCYLGLHDYSDGTNYRKKLTHCNEVFREDLNAICETTNMTALCKFACSIIELTVEKVGFSYRVFVSSQNKQALFLTQIQKLLEKNPRLEELNNKLKIVDLKSFQRKMRDFCYVQEKYLEHYGHRKKYRTYGAWDKRVLIPDVTYAPCFQEGPHQFVKSPFVLRTSLPKEISF